MLNLLYKQNDFGLFYDAQNNPITKEVLDAEHMVAVNNPLEINILINEKRSFVFFQVAKKTKNILIMGERCSTNHFKTRNNCV